MSSTQMSHCANWSTQRPVAARLPVWSSGRRTRANEAVGHIPCQASYRRRQIPRGAFSLVGSEIISWTKQAEFHNSTLATSFIAPAIRRFGPPNRRIQGLIGWFAPNGVPATGNGRTAACRFHPTRQISRPGLEVNPQCRPVWQTDLRPGFAPKPRLVRCHIPAVGGKKRGIPYHRSDAFGRVPHSSRWSIREIQTYRTSFTASATCFPELGIVVNRSLSGDDQLRSDAMKFIAEAHWSIRRWYGRSTRGTS